MSTIFYYLLKFEYDGSMAVLVTMLTQIIPLWLEIDVLLSVGCYSCAKIQTDNEGEI